MSISLLNKVVLITGASSGIGRASAVEFAKQGAKLILVARRKNRLDGLAKELKSQYETESLTIQLDVSDKDAVESQLNNLPVEWKDVDILVNNAGLALTTDKIQEGNIDNWDIMIDTNIKGLLYVTRQLITGMVNRNSGHIINIGSIAGQEAYPCGNVYAATKHAVRAINQSLRMDLLGSAIRISEIAPGAVETEFSEVRWNDKDKADAFYSDFSPLVAEDIADAVIYCATRPLHVDVAQITLYPTAQASATQLHRGKSLIQNIANPPTLARKE